MAGAAQVAHAWKEWSIQVLVLLSFTLQVMLLILAEFRPSVDSGVVRFFVWSAYQMAELIPIYVLGHMTVTGMSPEYDALVAFWAPFLLMHLGGQDNITAYAMEDNELWLRHLQTLTVQAAAVAYVLYTYSIFSSSHSLLLQLATILMFLVGAVKYGERVWALRYASSSVSGYNYRGMGIISRMSDTNYLIDPTARTSRLDAEDIIFLGHEMLDVPKNLLKGGPVRNGFAFLELTTEDKVQKLISLDLEGQVAYKVAEVQVSLMHDVLYTKAESQCGIIRLVSSLATALALLLLLLLLMGIDQHNNNGGNKKVDVAITCLLSVGAGVLEAVSLLRYFFSSFKWHRYEKGVLPERGLSARVLVSLRRFVRAADRKVMHSWSRSMAQHNMLQMSFRSKVSRSSKVARLLGIEDWWNTMVCSWSIPVSPLIEQMVVKQVLESCGSFDETSPDHILNSRGRTAIKRKSQQLYDRLGCSVNPDELSLDDTILIWHIATNLYISWYKEQMASRSCRQDDDHLAMAVDALSNYMLSLLAARPYMLPASASRNAYIEMCDYLTYLDPTSVEDLACLLRRYGDLINRNESPYKKWDTALRRGCVLATKLIDEFCGEQSPSADILELIGDVWVEMLCYVASRCGAYSHAKQLSDGGELITVVAFLIEYLKRGLLKTTSSTPVASAV